MTYFSQIITHHTRGNSYRVAVLGDLLSRKFRAFIFSEDSVTVLVLGDYSKVIDAHRAAIQLILKGYCHADG